MDAVAAMRALAHETRLGVFRALVRGGEVGAGALAEACAVPSTTLSFHLKELKQAGLVTVRREGRTLNYAPDFSTMQAVLGFLTENCCCGLLPTASGKGGTASDAGGEA